MCNTSLMLLEPVDDYVRYRIIPPNELLEEYNELLDQKSDRNKSDENLYVTTQIVCVTVGRQLQP